MTGDSEPLTAEAPAQTAGVVFQLRYALLRALEKARKDSTATIGVEKIDDVLLENTDGTRSIEQVKHTASDFAKFSDYSVPLWRTLGNWARLVLSSTVDLATVEFIFITNVNISPGSALDYLPFSDDRRQPLEASSRLRGAAASSENMTTEPDRTAFLSLSDTQQRAFVHAIRVVSTSGLVDVTSEIESALHYICEPSQLTDLTAELEGWWIQRLSEDLGEGRGAIVKLLELEARIAYLREKYKMSNLAIDEADGIAGNPETLSDYIFVRQLLLLNAREPRILNAQKDFLRARAQRSKWIREARVDPAEVNNYDRSLCDFWCTRFAIMTDEIDESTDENEKRRLGRTLLAWAETQIFPLRGAQAQFLTSGSYHALADEVRVGWHPDYETNL